MLAHFGTFEQSLANIVAARTGNGRRTNEEDSPMPYVERVMALLRTLFGS
jgi:hypothetical protein